jgi:hypothetical protein
MEQKWSKTLLSATVEPSKSLNLKKQISDDGDSECQLGTLAIDRLLRL